MICQHADTSAPSSVSVVVRENPWFFVYRDNYFDVFDADERIVMQGHGEPENPTYYDAWTENEHDLLATWEYKANEDLTRKIYTYTCEQ